MKLTVYNPLVDLGILIGLAVSNIFALLFLLLVSHAPRIAGCVTGIGFVIASATNVWMALTQPGSYVIGFGPSAAPGYRWFIYGPFAAHPAWYVLPIAAGQLAAGVLTLLGRREGPVGAMVFLLAITPLGIGSGFPAPAILAWAMWKLSRRAQNAQAAVRASS